MKFKKIFLQIHVVLFAMIMISCGPELFIIETGYGEIVGGANHSLAIGINSSIYSWGNNSHGQLGNGNTTNLNEPTQIITVPYNCTAAAAGNFHSLFISAGTLFSTGNNDHGQLGDSTFSERHLPVEVAKFTLCSTGKNCNFSAVAAGSEHSLALTDDGFLWAFGKNDFGQLGDGTTTDKNFPVLVGDNFKNSIIEAGHDHSLVLKINGAVWVWGRNDYGQLGDGTNESRSIPVQIGSGFARISAGEFFSVGIKTDGSFWSWGLNDKGQLGDGTYINRNKPVRILETERPNASTRIAAGGNHTITTMHDGTLWAWGLNDEGQLGDGTFNNQNIPVEVGGNYKGVNNRIAAGGAHSFAIKVEKINESFDLDEDYGVLSAWGNNKDGQLGDGTNKRSSRPIDINPL